MRPERRWPGLVLLACGIAATLSLALSGRLAWYIHPRSAWFTVLMGGIAAVLLAVGCAVHAARTRARKRAGRIGEADAPHAGHPPARAGTETRLRRALRRLGGGAIAALAVALLILFPPATLSTERAAQQAMPVRASEPGADPGADRELAALAGRADAELTLRDWSVLTRHPHAAAVDGRTAELLGFAAPDRDDPENVLVVTRFAITCCAVDAQAVGVPVYAPGWQSRFTAGDWLVARGAFAPNPSAGSGWVSVLLPEALTPADEPEDPYVG
ncbi:TIGR03943 family putative permease subunit [Leucobacter chromiireducens]|uniref:TIGR03943 family putative permease subunit n=1 Tax=Leucobacter chromiireducens TaxID=283877 RepID=UPI003F80E15B